MFKAEKRMPILKNSFFTPLFIKGHVFFARRKRDKRKELVIRALINKKVRPHNERRTEKVSTLIVATQSQSSRKGTNEMSKERKHFLPK